MKTETKTGRWKYAAIVLIVTLLVGLFWSYVKNGPKGEIYLYGEEHSKQSILDKELSIWGEYYEKGMRDLFVEFPYTDAQFLNLWMQADDDELLDLQFKDWEGTAGGTEVEKNFLKQIKEQYPETVFHGTDVGHTWERTGPRYLAYLEANGQKDSEEYRRAQENMEQGKRYYEIEATDEASSVRYREDRMVENFRRSYQELEAVRRTDIMGIYGSAHIVESEYLNSDLGQFTRHYTQTTKRGLLTTKQAEYQAPGKCEIFSLFCCQGFPKGFAPWHTTLLAKCSVLYALSALLRKCGCRRGGQGHFYGRKTGL